MSYPDLINGSFELIGAPFILLSIIRLHKDKQVLGINWAHPGFFTAWGLWNLYYYPHLGQWYSFIGGVAIVIVNAVWVAQMLYYSRKTL